MLSSAIPVPHRESAFPFGPEALVATSATIEDLQNRLQEHLGTRVTVHHGEKRGRIEIEYYGNDDLQRVLNALGLPAAEL